PLRLSVVALFLSFLRPSPPCSTLFPYTTLFRSFIDDNFIGFEFYGFCDGFGVGTEHYSADANVSVRSHFQQMFEERPPLVGKQRLRRAHSARSPAGENDGGQHVLPFSPRPWRLS